MTVRPCIVTARLDPVAQRRFDALRQAYFPPTRNYLAAHLTLFHHLPGDRVTQLGDTLRDLTAKTPYPAAQIDRLRFLGNGVAFAVTCPALEELHGQLAARWRDWLTPQDRQKFQPHITVQNKVPADTARALMTELGGSFQPAALVVEGLELWFYNGGPWEFINGYPFESPEQGTL